MTDIFKYYGIDWLLFILVLIHLWLLGNKNKLAFAFGILGCACGVAFGIMIESIASVAMNFTFGLLHLRALVKWSSNPKDVKPKTKILMNAIKFSEEDLNEIIGISDWESEGGSTNEGEK